MFLQLLLKQSYLPKASVACCFIRWNFFIFCTITLSKHVPSHLKTLKLHLLLCLCACGRHAQITLFGSKVKSGTANCISPAAPLNQEQKEVSLASNCLTQINTGQHKLNENVTCFAKNMHSLQTTRQLAIQSVSHTQLSTPKLLRQIQEILFTSIL